VVAPEQAGLTHPYRGKLLSIVPRTIYAKGLILVSVPLVIELALGMAMFALQHYYEARLTKERVAVETLFHANEMWNNCAEIMISQGQYAIFNGPEPSLAARIAQFHDEHRFLRKLVAHDPLRERELEQIHSCLWSALGLCDQLRPLESQGQSVSKKMRILMSDIAVASRAFHLVLSVQDKMRRFASPDRKQGKLKYLDRTAAVTEVDKATLLVDQVVLGSLAASTLVAVLLFLYFIRSINKGLNAVVENTERFERGEELKPPVEQGDELAQVDAALYEMAEEIREAQRTKQTILSTISHDLRTPLTAVLGHFSLLRSGAFGDTPAAAVTVAQKCEKDVLQLIRSINDLLDLDKIESGELSLLPKRLSVKKVIERAISIVMVLADERGVTVQGEESRAEIYADPDRIVQALANLLSSAVTLSPAGSSVNASALEHNGAVEIRVTSTGASTTSDLLNAQFDRYQRREHGLRLELPISKELITLHGGTVGAISNQVGCTFWCSLPCSSSSNQAA
jgi:signal transduction histidine kinase